MIPVEPEVLTVSISGTIVAAPDINPDYQGQSSPVVARVYQLKSPDAFRNSDFYALFDNEAATLGSSLIVREELLIQPGMTLEYVRTLESEATYIGVAMAFRDIEHARWRALLPMPDQTEIPLRIEVRRLAVDLALAQSAISLPPVLPGR